MYDVTPFMDDHPGGDEVLLSATGKLWYITSSQSHTLLSTKPISAPTHKVTEFSSAGKDATNDFEDVGHSDAARDMMEKYYIGEIDPSSVPLKRTFIPAQQAAYNHDKTSEFVIKILQFLVPLLILGLAFVVRQYTKKE